MKNELNEIIKAFESTKDKVKDINNLSEDISNTIKNGGRIVFSGVGLSARIIDYILEVIDDWYGYVDNEFIRLTDVVDKDYHGGVVQLRKQMEDLISLPFILIEDSNITEKDMIVGVSISGKTEFVLNSLKGFISKGGKTAIIHHGENDYDFEIDHNISLPIKSGMTQLTIMNEILTIIIDQVNLKLERVLDGRFIFINDKRGKEKNYAIESLIKLLGMSEKEANDSIIKNGYTTTLVMNIKDLDKLSARKFINENKYCLSSRLKK